jgi:hypothetical protein
VAISKSEIINSICPPLNKEIVEHLIDDYIDIKINFAFFRFRPSELHGGRFCESLLRLYEFFETGIYTPFGQQVHNSRNVLNRAEHLSLHDSLRLYIPKLCNVLLDIRNRRDVAHVGGDVSPNLSDSQFITHTSDWILTEIIRIYFNCSPDHAKKIVSDINIAQIPIITDIDGHIRIQNTNLNTKECILAILYSKFPEKIDYQLLFKWTEYSNKSRFTSTILKDLHKDALIHFDKKYCTLLPKGCRFVEANIDLNF